MINEMFKTFINDELGRRGWSFSALARNAGLSQGLVSQVMNGTTNPGLEFCYGLARAFNVRREDIFRRAGFIETVQDEADAELDYTVRRLPRPARASLLEYARFLDGRRPVLAVREGSPVYDVQALVGRLSPEQQAALMAFLQALVGE